MRGAVLFITCWLLYGPTVLFDFIQIDDPTHVLKNPLFQSPGGWKTIWSQAYFGLYVPVSYSIWLVWFKIFGPSPMAFHALNVLFHAINGVLVFRILFGLMRKQTLFRDVGAFVGALFFILHPLQGGSVAWVSEFRGIGSTTFSLLYLLVIIQWGFSRKWYWLVSSLPLLGLAILAKPNYVVMPLMGLLLVWENVRPRRDWAFLLVFFLSLSASFAAIQVTQSAQTHLVNVSHLGEKIWLAMNNLSFYFHKILIPFGLLMDYGLTISEMVKPNPTSVILVSLFILSSLVSLTTHRVLYFKASIIFFLALLPTLGLIPFGYQYYNTVADRYSYFALFGGALAFGTLMGSLPKVFYRFAFVYLILLGGLSFLNFRHYRSDKALALHLTSQNEKSFVGHTLLAESLVKEGLLPEAEEEYRTSIRLRPDYWVAHSQLGQLLKLQGRFAEIENHFLAIIKNDERKYSQIGRENLAEYYARVGLAQIKLGKIPEAKENLSIAQTLDPNLVSAIRGELSQPQ